LNKINHTALLLADIIRNDKKVERYKKKASLCVHCT